MTERQWFEKAVTTEYLLCYPLSRTTTALEMAKTTKLKLHPVPIEIGAFSDGEPNIRVPHLHRMTGRDVLYIANWAGPAERYADLCALTPIAEIGPASLTIAVPFMGTATMERESSEGVVATANVDAKLLSQLPCANKRIITIDLHTMQNQFFFHNAVVSLKSCMPSMRVLFEDTWPDAVFVFPDDGAHKRFAVYFAGANVAVCAKERDGDLRRVRLVEGDVKDKHTVIIDDLVRSGGTLIECAKVLRKAGATGVSVFVPHACFPGAAYQRFIDGDGASLVDTFVITDSVQATAASFEVGNSRKFQVMHIAQFLLEFLQ